MDQITKSAIVRTLMRALNFRLQREFADFIGLNFASISRLLNDDDDYRWTAETINKTIKALAEHTPPIVLQTDDWALSEKEFVAKVDEEISRRRQTSENDAGSKRTMLPHGRFLRLFIKPLEARQKKLAVHFADFWIKPSGTHEAKVEHRSLANDLEHANQRERQPHEHERPFGYLKLKEHTLDMVMEYGRDLPNSYYIGPRPIDRDVDWFVMINLDVNFRGQKASAQPMLFVTVEKDAAYPLTPMESGTKLFRATKSLLEECSRYYEGHFEMLLKGYDADAGRKVIDAVEQLRE